MHASGGVGPLKKMKKLHSVRGSIFQSWQHLSDWSSGPKHFTIFSKNCWTVENHLIRETTHTSSGAKSVLQTVDPTGEKKKKKTAAWINFLKGFVSSERNPQKQARGLTDSEFCVKSAYLEKVSSVLFLRWCFLGVIPAQTEWLAE